MRTNYLHPSLFKSLSIRLSHFIPSHPIPSRKKATYLTTQQDFSSNFPCIHPVQFLQNHPRKSATLLTGPNSRGQNNKYTQTQHKMKHAHARNVPTPTIPLRQRRRRRRRRRFLPFTELDHAFDIGVTGSLDRLSARREYEVRSNVPRYGTNPSFTSSISQSFSNLVVITRPRIAPLQLSR